jgi:hypothetical protein
MPQRRVLIRGGSAASMDAGAGDLIGDVLIEDDMIAVLAPPFRSTTHTNASPSVKGTSCE